MTENRSDIFLKWGLVLAILMVVGVYFYFFSFLGSSYSPYYGDEFFYFKNSESFAVNSSLEAAFTYAGSGSRLFGIDPHGPAYPLLYGIISKVIGWHNLNIPIINFGILVMALLALIFFDKRNPKSTFLQVLLVLGSPITLFYSITFLPELIHIGGGVLIYLFCKKYLSSRSAYDFWLLVGLIFVLGFFRNTWFFALIGLMILPIPLKGYQKSVFGVLGIILPFLFQYYLHEQVPNTFSGISESFSQNKVGEAVEAIFFNIKRNIYFAFTYTEGWFYTLQKIWLVATIGIALLLFRKLKLIQFGLVTLGVLILFNMILYKNYKWVDIRMYTAWIIFLNLGMISEKRHSKASSFLLFLNLMSFLLIIPFLHLLIHLRINPEIKPIPKKLLNEIVNMPEPIMVIVDPEILDDFNFSQLPISSETGKIIQYILPYYEQQNASPTHKLKLIEDQLSAYPVNNLKK